MTDETISDDPSYSRTMLYYNHAPRTKTNYEEFIIYDFVGMLGSFGGTLGLFVGFSFVGCISTFLKYSVILMDYIIKNGQMGLVIKLSWVQTSNPKVINWRKKS